MAIESEAGQGAAESGQRTMRRKLIAVYVAAAPIAVYMGIGLWIRAQLTHFDFWWIDFPAWIVLGGFGVFLADFGNWGMGAAFVLSIAYWYLFFACLFHAIVANRTRTSTHMLVAYAVLSGLLIASLLWFVNR